MRIINLTQHNPSPAQIEAGVEDLDAGLKAAAKALLTFDDLPREGEVAERAAALAGLVKQATGTARDASNGGEAIRVMIGGAPFLMGALERELVAVGFVPVYAFSRREVVEEPAPDGEGTVKRAVFRHLGFVPVAGG